MFTLICVVLLEHMVNFAGRVQDVNVSLESKFFPKIENSQTVENENRQHELSIAIVKLE